jgi:hypothetical protein
MTRRLVLPAICLCALGWAAPIAQAALAWQPALTISNPFAAPLGIEPVLSMGPSGDVAAVWMEGGNVVAAVRPAGTGVFTPQTVSTPGDNSAWPSAAVSASGAVAVTWIDETDAQYEVAVRPPGATGFSAPVQAGPLNGTIPQETTVAIDDAGNVLLGEVPGVGGGNSEVAYAWLPAGGAVTLTPVTAATSNASLPVVAMNGAGDAVVAWYDNIGTTHTIVRAITRPAGGAFGSTQTLTAGSDYAFNMKVAIGADGQAAIVWQAGTTVPPYRVEATGSAGPADLLTLPQTLSPAGGNSEHPAIGVGANGEAVAAWEQSGATGPEAVASAMAGGSFGAPTSLGEAEAGAPEVASDASGDALIAWGANLPGGGEGVEAVMRTAGGALSLELVLSEPGEKIDNTLSGIAPAASAGMDSAGEAVVGWERNGDHTVQARFYQAASSQTTAPPSEQPILTACANSVAFRTPTSSCPRLPICNAALARSEGSGSTGYPACAALAPFRCRVPRLQGLSKSAAKRRLLAADCELGKVRIAKRYKHAHRLVVAAQSIKAGRQYRAGTSVSLTLKPAPPRHKRRRG